MKFPSQREAHAEFVERLEEITNSLKVLVDLHKNFCGLDKKMEPVYNRGSGFAPEENLHSENIYLLEIWTKVRFVWGWEIVKPFGNLYEAKKAISEYSSENPVRIRVISNLIRNDKIAACSDQRAVHGEFIEDDECCF